MVSSRFSFYRKENANMIKEEQKVAICLKSLQSLERVWKEDFFWFAHKNQTFRSFSLLFH